MTQEQAMRAAHEHFRARYGQDADGADPTDRELLIASAVEAAEQLMRSTGCPGIAAASWDEDTGKLQLLLLRLG